MSSLCKPVNIGNLALSGNVFLAPVAGYTDAVFRGICVEHGASLTFTELVSSESLSRGGAARAATYAMLATADNERHWGAQLFGSKPEVMAQAVAAIAPLCPPIIDINAGCPVPKVVKTGAGAALMKNPALFGKVVEAVVNAARALSPAPEVTVKIRSGWDEASLNYAECARIAVEAGAAMVTLHPRTRSQGYGGAARWAHIGELAAALPVPVCGSGDLMSAKDAARMLQETGCAAVMFARGALGNPFIFDECRTLASGLDWTPPVPAERIEAALTHLRAEAAAALSAGLPEETACRAMRAHFCKYITGIQNAASMRNAIVHARSVREYEEICG